MSWEDPDLIFDFLVEAEEHLDEADAVLLALESSPGDGQLRRRLNGCFHTLKGMASYVDFKEVEELCHVTESLIGALPTTDGVMARKNVDLAFNVVTVMRQHFEAVADSVQADGPSPAPEGMVKVHARICTLLRACAS